MNREADPSAVTITRHIPLPWVLGLIGLFAVNIAQMYYGQQEQGRLISDQRDATKELSVQIKLLNTTLSLINIEVVKNSSSTIALERRINLLENQTEMTHQPRGAPK